MAEKQLVLVVDDDPDLVESVSMKLESENFRVAKAYDGVKPWRKSKPRTPGARHPGRDDAAKKRLRAVRELKKSDEYKDIVVVLLTAVAEAVTSTNYTHMDGKTTLADDYIPKPIELDRLLAIVKENLGIRFRGSEVQ